MRHVIRERAKGHPSRDRRCEGGTSGLARKELPGTQPPCVDLEWFPTGKTSPRVSLRDSLLKAHSKCAALNTSPNLRLLPLAPYRSAMNSRLKAGFLLYTVWIP